MESFRIWVVENVMRISGQTIKTPNLISLRYSASKEHSCVISPSCVLTLQTRLRRERTLQTRIVIFDTAVDVIC